MYLYTGWLSLAVEKLSDFFVGIVVLLGINGVITPPMFQYQVKVV
jgi:hypothetical protein